MFRWVQDVIFFRVVCATLFAVALLFTIILTDVFVDVDGYLMLKNNAPKNEENKDLNYTTTEKITEDELVYNDDQNSVEEDIVYRTRRSLNSNGNIPNLKNTKIKKILTNQLSVLLEELDDEETTKSTPTTTPEPKSDIKNNKNDPEGADFRHSLQHIILEDITGHLSLSKIYKMIQNMNKDYKEIMEKLKDRSREEHNILDEVIKYKKLETQIAQFTHQSVDDHKTETTETTPKQSKPKDRNIVIKSVIEVSNENNKEIQKDANIKGYIELIYNGKQVNLTQMNNGLTPNFKVEAIDRDTKQVTTKEDKIVFESKKNEIETIKHIFDKETNNFQGNSLSKMLKRYSLDNNFNNVEIKENKINRNKRDIKEKNKGKKHYDIEIETDFDEKGIKSDKGKKFITNIINKIRTALRSNSDVANEKNQNKIVFKKRIQYPILNGITSFFSQKTIPSFERVERREVEQINKVLTNEGVYDSEDIWGKYNKKPKFLTASKGVNSAEMEELKINYDEVLKNGILKRFQEPLSDYRKENENSTTTRKENGNITLILKNIDGSGFSIGFNQYVDNLPDKESLKAFNGLENVIKEYHRTYDNNEAEYNDESHKSNDIEETFHEITKRAVKNRWYYIAVPMKKKKYIFPKMLIEKKTPKLEVLNVNISGQHLNPLKTNLNTTAINRTIRSVKVHKVTNVKSKRKINRYINTNIMARKKFFLKNKRNKRQINEFNHMQVIARHLIPAFNSSDEDIYLFSRENDYSKKDKESKAKNVLVDTQSEESYNNYMPFNEIYNFQAPSKLQSLYSLNPYQAVLMSKYPHVFNDPKIQERHFGKNVNVNSIKHTRFHSKINPTYLKDDTTHSDNTNVSNEGSQEVEDIASALTPKRRYNVIVNISPKKNVTQANTGFKEFHTSVNKSFDENGLRYFSLLNISEISKIEKLNQEKVFSAQPQLNEDYENKKNEDLRQSIRQKMLLKLQKKKIDEQLVSLIKESQTLDSVINSFNNFDGIVSSPRSSLNPGKVTENITKRVNFTDIVKNRKKVEIEHELPNSDMQILKFIKRNENITTEILKKLDMNSNMLKDFLSKIFNKQTTKSHKMQNQNERSPETSFKSLKSINNNDYQRQLYSGPINTKNFKNNMNELQPNIFNTGNPKTKFNETYF